MSSDSPRKDVFHIREHGEGKRIWTRIGTAFVNKDGSINAILEALPIDGRMHIRDPKPPKNQKEQKP